MSHFLVRRSWLAGPGGGLRPRRWRAAFRLGVEWLEDRTLPASPALATAAPVVFNPSNTATASGFLGAAGAEDLFRIDLKTGDQLTADVQAQRMGSGLDSVLRVLDGSGAAIASNDNFAGRDAHLTFQAPADGPYFVDVSGSDSSTGLFSLQFAKRRTATRPDPVGAAFAVVGGPAVWGDTVTVTYRIENRGGSATAPSSAQVLLSGDNRFNGSGSDAALPNTTVVVPALLPGQAFTTSLPVSLPGAPLPGFTAPAEVFLGLRIGPGGALASPEQGNDWAALHVLTPQTAPEPNDSLGDARGQSALVLNSRTTGTLTAADKVDFFPIAPARPGLLTVRVHAAGVRARLSLLGPDGQLLVQSDGASVTDPDPLIAQHLDARSYFLKVEGLGGTAAYTLTTEFAPASLPFDPVAVGNNPHAVATADFNGDGIPDLAVGNQNGKATPGDVSILLGLGDGTFQEVEDGHGQSLRPAVGPDPVAVVAADFNGDGVMDLAVGSRGDPNGPTSPPVLVFFGNGDGTFQTPLQIPVVEWPVDLVAADFNQDGILDLAGPTIDNGIIVLLGQPGGTFTNLGYGAAFSAANPAAVVAADFNGDGIPDLATSNNGNAAQGPSVTVDLGKGDGTFQDPVQYSVGDAPFSLVAADFTGRRFADGAPVLDLATANSHFNFDTGRPTAGGDVSVLLNNGDGTFQSEVRLPAGSSPFALVAGDFNGDGRADLATANNVSDDLSVLLGKGDGTFAAQQRFAVGSASSGLAAGDFDGDGRVDLAATAGGPGGSVTALRGLGDGTFQDQVPNPVGPGPVAVITGDLNNDGRADIVTANRDSNDISVLLGNGDGTFQPEVRVPVGQAPAGLVAGDFNNDGNLDLAVVNYGSDDVSILLGNGDGTFHELRDAQGRPRRPKVGPRPRAIVAGRFQGGLFGNLDLAVANSGFDDALGRLGPGSVSVLLGQGDGTFMAESPVSVGGPAQPFTPVALVAGNFNGDLATDLATLSSGISDTFGQFPGEVAVLLGNGDGTFTPRPPFSAVSYPPLGLAVAGSHADSGSFLGVTSDLVVTGGFDGLTGSAALFLGQGDGTFAIPGGDRRFPTGSAPVAAVATDLGADFLGEDPGLVIANRDSGDLSVFRSKPDGTLAPVSSVSVGGAPRALAVDDFNNDDIPDLAVASGFPGNNVSVLLGLGGGTFAAPGTVSAARATPLLADVNGDGRPDVVSVSQDGRILLRLARPDAPGTFAPPVVLNPDPFDVARAVVPVYTTAPGGRKTFLALAALDGGSLVRPSLRVASVDTSGISDPGLAALAALGAPSDAHDPSVSLYMAGPAGKFTRENGPLVPGALPIRLQGGATVLGSLPVGLFAGDLNGDGRDDLVVTTAGAGPIFVYLQTPQGTFGPPAFQLPVGLNPTEVRLADVDGDSRPDIVVTDRLSGDVQVFFNTAAAPLTTTARFRAGTGPYGVTDGSGAATVRSREGTAGVVVGRFEPGSTDDLVVANSDAHTLSLLRASGSGGFLNPVPALPFPTGGQPLAVAAGDFNGDGNLDLAVLEPAGLEVFTADGAGGFRKTFTADAGNAPGGLTVADVNGDGNPDLLVGNAFGDVLVLLGNGDGTFLPYRRADRKVTLAVADLTGQGRQDVVLADESLDRVTVQYATGQRFTQGQSDGVLAPSAVRLADVNGDGIPDLLVANGGGNDVLVYLGLGDGQFGPARPFPVGTDPVGITIQDLNGDGIPDLVVANQGSNDVSVLFGQGRGPDWTLTNGPRLGLFDSSSGQFGVGPVSTTLADFTGDGIPDLLVTNSQSDNVFVLPGTGNGFFAAQSPFVLTTGSDPQQAIVGNFAGHPGRDLAVIDSGSNEVMLFPDFGPGRTIPTGGQGPQAALAGDFNGDGFTDLVIANNASGQVALLLGSADGPALAQETSDPGELHPTDLALAAAGDDAVSVYVAAEGQDAAVLLNFDLHFGIGVASFSPPEGAGPPPPVPAPAPGEVTPTLEPLPESNLAVVATLMSNGTGGQEVAGTSLPSPAAAPGAEPLTGFVIGLENPSLTRGVGGPAEDNAADNFLGLLQPLVAAGRRVIGEWWPAPGGTGSAWQVLAGAGLSVLEDAATAARSALAPLGLDRIELPSLPVRQILYEVAGAVYESAVSALQPMGQRAAPQSRSDGCDLETEPTGIAGASRLPPSGEEMRTPQRVLPQNQRGPDVLRGEGVSGRARTLAPLVAASLFFIGKAIGFLPHFGYPGWLERGDRCPARSGPPARRIPARRGARCRDDG